jgi:SAM-dependent methyltransferase
MKLNLMKAIEPGGKADYGLDAPGVIRNLTLLGLAELGLALFFPFKLLKLRGWVRLWPLTAGFGTLYIPFRMFYYSKQQKFKHRDRLLDLAELQPDSRVLDLGSGRGLLAIGAAKRLPGLRVTAVDTWQPQDLSGNSEEALRSNIDLEEVGGRVHVYQADARRLPFEPNSFDVVVSNLGLHNIGENAGLRGGIAKSYRRQERAKALAEIARVLAPRGRAVISDFHYIDEAAAELTGWGLTVTVHGPFRDTMPAQKILIADKAA